MRYFTADNLNFVPGLVHAFMARRGGASGGPDEESKLGRWKEAHKNFEVATRHLGISRSQLVLADQVHGAEVLVIAERPGGAGPRGWGQADALITSLKGVSLGVLTADCLPIILFDPRCRAIGIAHAGLRGSLLRVAGAAVDRMVAVFGCRREGIMAALGPGIGPCCYRVGEEVVERFASGFAKFQEFTRHQGNGKFLLDLTRANISILREAGLSPDKIVSLKLCTRCRMDLFHSFRGSGGRCGQQLSFVTLRDEKMS